MRLACSTFPFQGLPLAETFIQIHELGFRYSDLVISHDPRWGHIQPEQVLNDPLPVLEQLEEAEAKSRVKIAAFNVSLEMASISERGQFEAVCKLARRMRVPLINVVAGERDELVEFRRLRDFHALAAECGALLAVETYVPSLFARPKQAAELAEALRGTRLTLDTGHLLQQGIAMEAWEPLYPHVGHVHVKDAGPTLDRYQVPFGEGGLQVGTLVEALRHVRFGGTLSIEYAGSRPGDAIRIEADTEIARVRQALLAAAPELGEG